LRSLGEDLRLERGTGWRVIEEEIEGVLQLEIETIRKVGAVILLDLKLELLIEFCLLLLQKVEGREADGELRLRESLMPLFHTLLYDRVMPFRCQSAAISTPPLVKVEKSLVGQRRRDGGTLASIEVY